MGQRQRRAEPYRTCENERMRPHSRTRTTRTLATSRTTGYICTLRGPRRPYRIPLLLGGPVRRLRHGRVDALVLGVRRAREPDPARRDPRTALRPEPTGGGRLRAR